MPEEEHHELKNKLSNMTTEESKDMLWTVEMETILCTWADQSKCYYWLCYRAHKRYSMLQALFSIPTIIFSTIVGAASFTNISGNFAQYLPLAVGSVNVGIGIFTTIQQYFKISEYNENFRICARAWDKYAREIQLELSKPPEQRKDCGLFLKKCSEDFERLMETTPDFPDDIIKGFVKEFRGRNGSDKRHRYDEMTKPNILSGLNSTSQYRNPWYIENEKHGDSNNNNEWYSEVPNDKKTIELIEKIVSEKLENILTTDDNILSKQEA